MIVVSDVDKPDGLDSAEYRRAFRTYQAVIIAVIGLALLPLFFVESKLPYAIIWAMVSVDVVVISWLGRARVLGRISPTKSRVLAPAIAVASFAFALVAPLSLR